MIFLPLPGAAAPRVAAPLFGRPDMNPQGWSEDKKIKLEALWNLKDADGRPLHSTAGIAAILGITKNAAVGMVHRMQLTPRPSPIAQAPRNGEVRKARPKRAPKTTLPLGGAVAALPPTPTPLIRLTAGPCCWPIGEPGTKAFRYCEDPSMAGKPYCDDHCKKAYVKVQRERQEPRFAP